MLEHVAHAACADTDKHLDEVGTGNGEEGHIGFTGYGTRQQGLTGARRTDQEAALGDLAAQSLELLRVAQELDQFLQFDLGFLDAGDILECDAARLLGQQAGTALAEAHGLAAAGLHLAHEIDPYANQEDHRAPGDQDLA